MIQNSEKYKENVPTVSKLNIVAIGLVKMIRGVNMRININHYNGRT